MEDQADGRSGRWKIRQMEDQKEQPQQKPRQNAGASDIVMKETMSLESVRETMHEEQGYDAPFATLTWKHWLDLQTQTMQCFSRFVRAVEEHRADHAIMIGLEIHEIATSMLLEAYAQCTNVPLEELPADRLRYVKA